MKTVFYILIFPSIGWSITPQFTYPENHKLDQEMNNIYRNLSLISTTQNSMTRGNSDITQVRNFGVKCDTVTDDTVALQSAMNTVGNGGWLYFPPGICKISACLKMPVGLKMQGTFTFGNISNGTEINQVTASTSVICMPDTGAGFEEDDTFISHLHLNGGLNGISATNGMVAAIFRDMLITGFSSAAILTPGFTQQDYFDTIQMTGGNYAILANANGSGGAYIFDKNLFNNIYTNSTNINSLNIVPTAGNVGNTNMFSNFVINTVKQTAVVLGNGMTNDVFINFNMEGTGNKASPRARSTLSISVGVSTGLFTSSDAGYVIGDTLTVAGGNTNGTDWYPYITALSGSSVTLSVVAPQTLTSVDVSPALYSGFQLNGAKVTTFINVTFASDSGSGEVRYGADASQAQAVTIVGCASGPSPVYDPGGQVQWIGSINQTGPIRDSNETISSFQNTTNMASSNTYSELGNIILPAGDWDISINICFINNTETGLSYYIYGIGTAAGNSAAGLLFGDSAGETPLAATSNSESCHSIPSYRVSTTAQTTYYEKMKAGYASGTPQAAGRISARRIHPY